MADPIALIATELPDGSVAERYQQLPDGSWAPVTDTDDAPCCCGPGGCFVILLPCCSCPGALAYIEDSAQLAAAWPYESRNNGDVVVMGDGRCYRYIATVPDRPADATIEYSFASIVDFVSSCSDPQCTNNDCVVAVGGLLQIFDPCGAIPTLYDCVESYRYTYSESGTGNLQLDPSSPFFEYNISAGTSFTGEWSLGQGATGEWTAFTRGTREGGLEWDYSESYDQSEGIGVFPIGPEPAAEGRFANGNANVPPEVWSVSTDGFGSNPGSTGHNQTIDGANFCEQGVRRETTGNTTRTSIVNVVRSAFSTTVHASWTRTERFADGRIKERAYNRLTRRLSYNNVRFTSGIDVGDIESVDACEIPSTVIAYKCNAEDPSDPSVQIIVDLAEVPDPGSLQYRAWYDGELYIVTGELAEGEPLEVVWTLDECEDDPSPTGDIYRINRCNSTQQAIGAQPNGNGPPLPITIGYRPGDGLAPGEGFVRYRGIDGGGCLFSFPGQPTTQVLDEEPDLILTSQAGLCRSQPTFNIDPRPECQRQPGGGGVTPSDDLNIIDPALQAELDRQAMSRSGQYPGRCPSCGG